MSKTIHFPTKEEKAYINQHTHNGTPARKQNLLKDRQILNVKGEEICVRRCLIASVSYILTKQDTQYDIDPCTGPAHRIVQSKISPDLSKENAKNLVATSGITALRSILKSRSRRLASISNHEGLRLHEEQTELPHAGLQTAAPKSLGKQMFPHAFCNKILTTVALTCNISQGPNSANVIFGIAYFEVQCFCAHRHTHTQLTENYSFLLKDEENTYHKMTNSIYHRC